MLDVGAKLVIINTKGVLLLSSCSVTYLLLCSWFFFFLESVLCSLQCCYSFHTFTSNQCTKYAASFEVCRNQIKWVRENACMLFFYCALMSTHFSFHPITSLFTNPQQSAILAYFSNCLISCSCGYQI